MQPITHIVELEGFRLDRHCSKFIPQVSSLKRAKKWIKCGWITLNGKRAQTGWFVKLGDQIQLTLPDELLPVWERELDKMWEDEHLAVVYKPPGMPVHSQDRRSLRHTLGFALQPTKERDALVQFEPVHRLDARTQGLMLIAKTATVRGQLGLDFADHQSIHKVYQCLVVGELADGESHQPIDEKPAHSRWNVLSVHDSAFTGKVSLVEVQIYTGRTHQIRKHMLAQGTPILGDDLYTVGNPLRKKGLFLAATQLGFVHPITDVQIHIYIPTPQKFHQRLRYEATYLENKDGGNTFQ